MNNTTTTTESTLGLEKTESVCNEPYGLMEPAHTSNTDCKTIHDALGALSDNLSTSAVTINNMLKKNGYSNQDFENLFTKLFEEEEEKEEGIIKKLFFDEPIDNNPDYSIVTMLIRKYLWEKIVESLFGRSIHTYRNDHPETKLLEEMRTKLQSFKSNDIRCYLLLRSIQVLAQKTKNGLQDALEKRKPSVVDEMFRDLDIDYLDAEFEKSQTHRLIEDLVDLAADVSLYMHRAEGKIKMQKLIPGDLTHTNQVESACKLNPSEESETTALDTTIALGISPVFLYENAGDNVSDTKSDTHVKGYSLCYRGSAVLASRQETKNSETMLLLLLVIIVHVLPLYFHSFDFLSLLNRYSIPF